MTEQEARAVLLLQAVEDAPASALWTAEDRRWATRAAAQEVPADAPAEAVVVARARLAAQRLAPRDAGLRRALAARGWHAALPFAALLLGALLGVLSDGLVAGPYFNLLSPVFWGLLAWNLVVYALLAMPVPAVLKSGLARGLLLRVRGSGVLANFAARWATAAQTLARARIAALLHLGAAGLALGLVAGLVLRGLVLDYRAGWATTLLSVEAVQAALAWGFAPVWALTGHTPPDMAATAALRVLPGQGAAASAAPWIAHMALMLGLLVVLPRGLLAAAALWRARRLAQQFPLAVDDPAFARWQLAPAATLWALPLGQAPTPQAALGLRAVLGRVWGEGLALTLAAPLPWGEEEHPPAPPPGARVVVLVDLASTPEAEVHGRLLQALQTAQPLVVADEAGFVRRFGRGDRLAQRQGAWRALLGRTPFLSVDLEAPDLDAAERALRLALAH
ncbi:MAG: DUF2868 domain-containing protein [Rubrivivax sp.]|nr:DUF2868 domain-containing protein [Rubrivivax sp.]